MMSSSPLPKLIGKADWSNVKVMLHSNPEAAREPIPTRWENTVFPLHQAVCKSSKRGSLLPCDVLQTLIDANPTALDYNVFLGACGNKQTKVEVMKILFKESDTDVLITVQQSVNDLIEAALDCDNGDIVELLMEKYATSLRPEKVLHQAVVRRSSESIETILHPAFRHNVRSVGVLLEKQYKMKESALEAAWQQFDVNDSRSVRTLEICVQYASVSRLETGKPDPKVDYPFLVASIGRVPLPVCKKILDMQNEVEEQESTKKTNVVRSLAIQKAMQLAYEKPDFQHLPKVFFSQELIQACEGRSARDVETILKENADDSGVDKQRRERGVNALDLAIQMYEEDDNILRICVQYLNAKNMGFKFPAENYPTLFAAVGYVPKSILMDICKKYKDEIKTDSVGKATIKKMIWLGLGGVDLCIVENQTNAKLQTLPLTERRISRQRITPLETINEAMGLVM